MAGPHGILNGTEIKIYAGSNLIAYSTSATIHITMGTRETTGFYSQAWESCMEGTRSWTMNIDGMYAWETDGGANPKNADFLFNTYLDTRSSLQISFGTKDAEAGDVRYYGMAFLTSLTMTGGTEDSATFSASFKGNGNIYIDET
jgi:hypothetical protein